MFDPRGEIDFIEDCQSVLAERTVILITHRPASLALADRVLVMANGRLSEDSAVAAEPLRGATVAGRREAIAAPNVPPTRAHRQSCGRPAPRGDDDVADRYAVAARSAPPTTLHPWFVSYCGRAAPRCDEMPVGEAVAARSAPPAPDRRLTSVLRPRRQSQKSGNRRSRRRAPVASIRILDSYPIVEGPLRGATGSRQAGSGRGTECPSH